MRKDVNIILNKRKGGYTTIEVSLDIKSHQRGTNIIFGSSNLLKEDDYKLICFENNINLSDKLCLSTNVEFYKSQKGDKTYFFAEIYFSKTYAKKWLFLSWQQAIMINTLLKNGDTFDIEFKDITFGKEVEIALETQLNPNV